ncbi:CD74 molecule, major histocompatibility complex, class II invariant chain b [Pempheris klunzingeri]|uniref:CD74 molecule, major histocompatibility complex, class II invariant chain b n=1 Tax=Pempheris klunzingeri TaxID=3127111 RepID=UPI00397F24BE
MSEPETQTLISATSQQTAINVPAQGGRPSRAYKVAGLTLLACVLIAGQAMIAYFLLTQRSDIRSLEEQSTNLKTELSRGNSASVPMRMHIPMKALPNLMDDSVDEDSSTGAPEKSDRQQATQCQLEAAGLVSVQVPGFHPACDERGLYQAQQCFMGSCWCVSPVNGQQIPGSLSNGPAICRAMARTGGQMKALSLPDSAV